MAGEFIVSAQIGLQKRIDDYVAERRRLGFQVHSRHTFLTSFANYVALMCCVGERGMIGRWFLHCSMPWLSQ